MCIAVAAIASVSPHLLLHHHLLLEERRVHRLGRLPRLLHHGLLLLHHGLLLLHHGLSHDWGAGLQRLPRGGVEFGLLCLIDWLSGIGIELQEGGRAGTALSADAFRAKQSGGSGGKVARGGGGGGWRTNHGCGGDSSLFFSRLTGNERAALQL